MHVKEGDVALDLRGAEHMRATTVLVQVPSSAAEHALVQIGTPLLSMPVSLTPLTLRGEFLVGPILRAIDCLGHLRDVAR